MRIRYIDLAAQIAIVGGAILGGLASTASGIMSAPNAAMPPRAVSHSTAIPQSSSPVPAFRRIIKKPMESGLPPQPGETLYGNVGQHLSLTYNAPADAELAVCGFPMVFKMIGDQPSVHSNTTIPKDGDPTKGGAAVFGITPLDNLGGGTITLGYLTLPFCASGNPYYIDTNSKTLNLILAPTPPPRHNVEPPCLDAGPGAGPGTDGATPPCRLRGQPVDVTTGELRNDYTDLKLSGPFGLEFHRFYGSQSTGFSDLGLNWHSNFSGHISFSSAVNPAGGIAFGNPVFWDYQDQPHYFGKVGPGGSSYSNISKMTLSLNTANTLYTVKTFSGVSYSMDASTGALVSITDRFGNSQSIGRDPNTGAILNVTDALGRMLCFTHDTKYPIPRITSVFSLPSGGTCPNAAPAGSTVVSYTYDYGTSVSGSQNCTTNDLCSVTDADGKIWRFAYQNQSNNAQALLIATYDPLGNPTEMNSFDASWRVTDQQRGSNTIGNLKHFSYISDAGLPDANHTVVTNPQTGTRSDFHYDEKFEILDASGPECFCDRASSKTYAYDSAERLISETDPGNSTSGVPHVITYGYERDAGGQMYPGPTKVVETLDTNGTQRTTVMSYYPVGDSRQDLVRTQQVASVAGNGAVKQTTLTYAPNGTLIGRVESGLTNGMSVNYAWQYAYDQRGRLTSVQGPRSDVSQTAALKYYADNDPDRVRAGQLQSITDALGHTTTYCSSSSGASYDVFGNSMCRLDPNGVTISKGYDRLGRLTTFTIKGVTGDKADLVSAWQYDAAGRLLRFTRPAGNGIAIGYDSASRPVTITRIDSQGSQYEQVAKSYDTSDKVVSVTALGCLTPSSVCSNWLASSAYGYQYDTLDRLIEVDDPTVQNSGVGSVLSQTKHQYAYTSQGALAIDNDENHQLTFSPPNVTNIGYTYDQVGRKTSEIRFLPTSTSPAGASGSLSANSAGYSITRYAYDIQDNVSSFVDPNENLTTYTYDDFNRVTAEQSLVSGTKTYQYDADDNVTRVTYASGASTTISYDALNRRLQSVSLKPNHATETILWSYDDPAAGRYGIGRLSKMTDPTGSTTYMYDRRGLLTTKRQALSDITLVQSYQYDQNGNRSALVYPSGRVVTYGYDFADRPLSAVFSNSAGFAAFNGRLGATVTRTRLTPPYAPRRLTTRESGSARLTSPTLKTLTPIVGRMPRVGFHALTFSRQVPVNLPRRAQLDQQAFRALAAVSRVGKPGPSTIAIGTRQLRARNSVGAGQVLVSSVQYAPFGAAVSITFGNGVQQQISRDAEYRPIEDRLASPTGITLADFQNSYDAVGNVTSVTDNVDASFNKTFMYDDADRLINGTTGVSAPTAKSSTLKSWLAASYFYDPMGNLTSAVVGPRSQAFSYNGSLPTLHAVVTNGTQVGLVSYDADGNESQVGFNSYDYSARGHLSSAQGVSYGLPSQLGVVPGINTGKWLYGYDGDGDRISTTIVGSTTPLGTGGIETRYSSMGADHELLAETTLAPSGQGIAYEYIYLGGMPVAQIDATGTHYTAVDATQFSAIQTDAAGSISYWADAEPFGAVYTLRSADSHQPLRYPGQTAEQFETGANGATDLIYNGARWYRPSFARYTQPDPAGLSADINPYRYALDSPVNYTDMSGNEATRGPRWREYIQDIRQIGDPIKLAKAASARDTADGAFNEFGYEFRDKDGNRSTMGSGGRGKAFHHCYWSCLMTQQIGADAAAIIGYNHEAYSNDGVRSKDDGFEQNGDRLMDLANNAIGRKLGSCARTDCKGECKNRAVRRKLKGFGGDKDLSPQAN